MPLFHKGDSNTAGAGGIIATGKAQVNTGANGINARGGAQVATGRGSISAPAANAAAKFARLSATQRQEVVRLAAASNPKVYNFALKLSLGTPIDAPLEIVSKVLGIIENVTSHFRK